MYKRKQRGANSELRITQERWTFKDEYYGPLIDFVKDDNVTDINFNGKDVWIDNLVKGRYKADLILTKEFVESFSVRVADAVSEQFNQYKPLLEAETDVLRISIIHEAVANTGRSISIRKTPAIRRLNQEMMLESKYATEEIISLLQHCVEGKLNILICGLPGTGKTELLKWLTSFIPANDRVITIEDNLEIHYAAINNSKDCVELKVDMANFDYVDAIKACLRQNPQWILLSEARSTEVKYLLESMSTGTHCLTTIHTDDVRKVPDRVKNMIQDPIIADKIENDVFAFLNVAVLVKKKEHNGKIARMIDQICFFSRENGENLCSLIVDEGKIISKEIPNDIIRKLKQNEVSDIFSLADEDEFAYAMEDEFDSTEMPELEHFSVTLAPEDDNHDEEEKNIFYIVQK